MEIKRTISSAPTSQINETAETPATPERISHAISAIPDELESVDAQNILLLGANLMASPVDSATPEIANLTPLAGGVTYPPEILNLAQVTGKSPAELTALFNKYGLDPANLPVPPDRRVAELFNDPAFDSTLNDLKSQIPSTYENYKNEIDNQTAQANNINASNVASDSSVGDDLNTAPFEYLYNAKNGANTPEGQAWIQQREQTADRVAELLSAMYPGAEISSNPAAGSWGDIATSTTLPGFIEFNGQPFNAVPDSSTGEIQFGNQGTKVDYPEVQLVTWEYDANGAGATQIPDWMQQTNYPTHAYDNPWNQN